MWSFTSFCLVMVIKVLCHGAKADNRIIQGQEASDGQFPYQVSISFRNYLVCSGSIISEQYIVTAAHSLGSRFKSNPSSMIVRAGSIDRTSGTNISIADIVIHPDYDSYTRTNDVAMLRTESLIEFTDYIQPINLPPVGRVVTGEVTVSGWGITEDARNATRPINLMYVTLTAVDQETCQDAYEDVADNMWCAGNDMEGAGACRGDVGGPATQDGLLVGIILWDGACGDPGDYNVFANTSTSSINNFITDTAYL